MSRAGFVFGLLVLGVLSAAEDAQAARHVGLTISSVIGNPTGTYYIGTQTIGETSVQTLFSGSFSGTDSSETTRYVRDQMMPEEGILGIGKRSNGADFPGIQVYHPDSVQFLVSTDEEDWVVLEPNLLVYVQVEGTTLVFTDKGSNGFAPVIASSIPAISGIGLLVMVAGMVAAAGFVLRRRGVLVGQS